MRERIIRALGGYVSLDDAIEEIRHKADKTEKRALLTMAVRRLYNTVSGDDILKNDPASGQWTWQGRPLSKEDTAVLIEQAKGMLDSRLWAVLKTDIQYQANKRMFIDSQNVDDIVAGKLLLYYADIIHTRLKRLAGL